MIIISTTKKVVSFIVKPTYDSKCIFADNFTKSCKSRIFYQLRIRMPWIRNETYNFDKLG